MNDHPFPHKALVFLSVSIWAWLPWVQMASQACAVLIPFMGFGWWLWRIWKEYKDEHRKP